MLRLVWQNGGTLNYRWHETIYRGDAAALAPHKAEVERMGYPVRLIAADAPLPVDFMRSI